MRIRKSVIKLMKGNSRIMSFLCLEFEKSESSIRRWIDNNNPMLTTFAALRIIRQETGLTDKEILIEEPVE
jgi:hypothetical protein